MSSNKQDPITNVSEMLEKVVVNDTDLPVVLFATTHILELENALREVLCLEYDPTDGGFLPPDIVQKSERVLAKHCTVLPRRKLQKPAGQEDWGFISEISPEYEGTTFTQDGKIVSVKRESVQFEPWSENEPAEVYGEFLVNGKEITDSKLMVKVVRKGMKIFPAVTARRVV